jgi:hypothetical protein
MKIINNTHWQTMPMKKILTRLSRKLGRRQVDIITIKPLKTKGSVQDYSSFIKYDDRPVAARGREATLWVPPLNINQFWFARIADDMMRLTKVRYTHDPTDIRLDMQLAREYEWAASIVIDRQLPPKKRTRASLVSSALKKLDKRIIEQTANLKALNTKVKRTQTSIKNLTKSRVKLAAKLNKIETEPKTNE